MDLDDRLILIPSKEFQKKAVKVRTHSDALYVLTTTLSRTIKASSKYIINKEQLVGNILEKFKEIETAEGSRTQTNANAPKLLKTSQRPLLILPFTKLESKLEWMVEKNQNIKTCTTKISCQSSKI